MLTAIWKRAAEFHTFGLDGVLSDVCETVECSLESSQNQMTPVLGLLGKTSPPSGYATASQLPANHRLDQCLEVIPDRRKSRFCALVVPSLLDQNHLFKVTHGMGMQGSICAHT